MSTNKLDIIGANTLVTIGEHNRVPATIDTGTDCSSVWASDITITDKGVLRFTLFDKKSPYYNGKLFERREYKTTEVKQANGHIKKQYRVPILVVINGRKIRATFILEDRSHERFPVVIGRCTLRHKFLIDVSKHVIPEPTAQTKPLSKNMGKQETVAKPVKKEKVVKEKKISLLKWKHAKNQKKVLSQNSDIKSILKKSLSQNGYKKRIASRERHLYFEKYKNSFALSDTLFKIYTLWQGQGVDLRADFIKVYPLIKLRRLSDRLLTDPKALLYLSSYAVNIICLTEILYPRNEDMINKLARIALTIDPDAQPALYVELCTQIIIADSQYYKKPISNRNKLLLRQLLRRASVYRKSFSNNLPKSIEQKFLVCAKLVDQEKKYLKKK